MLLVVLLALFWPVPRETTHAALLSHGWSVEAAVWVTSNIRVDYDERDQPEGRVGGFAPSGSPQPGAMGRITVAPGLDPAEEAAAIEEEAHHAWDAAHGFDEAAVRADMEALAASRDEGYRRAAHVAWLLLSSDDVAHYNHRLAEALDFDFTLVPRAYAERHFGYAAQTTALPRWRYRLLAPLTAR